MKSAVKFYKLLEFQFYFTTFFDCVSNAVSKRIHQVFDDETTLAS